MAVANETDLEVAREEVAANAQNCVKLEELMSASKPSNGQCVVVGGACVPAQALCNFAEQLNQGKVAAPKETPEDDRIVLLRALAAEAIGTGLIVLFGCGSVCATLSGAYSGVWQVAAVWGLGVSLAIYCTAEASGAHLNPAVTLAFLLVRPQAHGMTVVKSLLYVVAQMVGAILAGALNLLIYGGTIAAFERENNIVRGEPRSILSASAFGEYFPNPGLSKEYGSGPYAQDDVSVFGALMTEAWGTLILAFVIFGITNGRNKVLGSAERVGVPFVIGMTVAVLLPLYAPITQAGWNPARDFGPRIVAVPCQGVRVRYTRQSLFRCNAKHDKEQCTKGFGACFPVHCWTDYPDLLWKISVRH
ncbi:glpF [Symbiodinium microadriaticum]|nr:glpF [Symbiodinium microadriaticum]